MTGKDCLLHVCVLTAATGGIAGIKASVYLWPQLWEKVSPTLTILFPQIIRTHVYSFCGSVCVAHSYIHVLWAECHTLVIILGPLIGFLPQSVNVRALSDCETSIIIPFRGQAARNVLFVLVFSRQTTLGSSFWLIFQRLVWRTEKTRPSFPPAVGP